MRPTEMIRPGLLLLLLLEEVLSRIPSSSPPAATPVSHFSPRATTEAGRKRSC